MVKLLKQEISEARDALIDCGVTPEGSDRLIRLFTGKPTDEERRRWIETNVMDEDGNILVDADNCGDKETSNLVQVVLFDLVYDGKITRTFADELAR